MATRTKIIPPAWHEAMRDVPNWPTTMRSNLGDGRLIGVSPNSRDGIGSVWLYKKVPLGPMLDARDDAELERSAAPLAAAFEALGRAATTVGGRRLAEASYREFHLLTINVPKHFRPPADHPLHEILLESFGDRTVEQRLVLLGVRLVPAVDMSSGIAAAVQGFMESLTSAGVPLVEFTKDFHRLDAELSRAGLVTPRDRDIRLANCWWNLGRYPDTPMMAHHNHLHLFGTVDAAVRATRSAPENCADWGVDTVPDEWAVTMASVTDFEVEGLSTLDRGARWASRLLDIGALTVSMRGKVEPAKVTRGVIRRNKELYERDIHERYAAGKSGRGEQESRLAELSGVEDLYATGGAPPTVKDLSTIVGFDGSVPDLRDIAPADLPLVLAPMSDLQTVALAETQLCSPARGNPTLHDVPAHLLTYSGVTSLSVVGDAPRNSVLLGFTETDRQPVWMNMSAAANEDTYPTCICPGASGSGKTLLAQWLAYQTARTRNASGELTPVVLINPKPGQSLRTLVDVAGGNHFRLDELTSADGAVDPLRFAKTPDVGLDLAASVLLSINPWGPHKAAFEIPLFRALKYGISAGANATGQALRLARADLGDPVITQLVDAVDTLLEAVPQARALIGVTPHGDGLRVSEGLTLIEVGDSHLNLPQPGADADVTQRIALSIVRMLVFGTMSALTGRQGVVFLDEGWVFTSAGMQEMDRLGRLARSLEVFPILLTQKVSDALAAGLAGYISRGLIMHISDVAEARASFQLFKLDPTPERMTRVTAKPRMGGDTDDDDQDHGAAAFDWRSLKALTDGARRVHRGAVGYHIDLAGRCVPTEISIPDWFIRIASTNGLDIRARDQARAAAPVPALELPRHP